jgi:hypothetical protein
MSLPDRRPAKISSRNTRNFARRDWTSIGLRGARVSFSKARTRTKPGSSGNGLSHRQMEESRMVGFDAPESNPPLATGAPPEKDWCELLWLGLIMLAIAAAATAQVMR